MRTLSAFPVILILVLATVGCEPEPTHYWFNPMRTLEQGKTDCAECRQRVEAVKAETAAARQDQGQGLEDPRSEEEQRRQDARLDTLGAWDQMYLEQVFSGCMGGKGYFKVEADRLPRDVQKKSTPDGDFAGR